ncbi:MAG: hypothetical protein HRU09_21140, partial [Oligoflexales bacterium]|nr:hypothetical protein [Oligoflexales bacterium]
MLGIFNREKNAVVLAFIILAAAIFLGSKPKVAGFDGVHRYNAMLEILSTKVEGQDDVEMGKIERKYGSSIGLLASPLWFIGNAIYGNKTPEAKKQVKQVVAHFNHLVVMLFVIWLYSFLVKELSWGRLDSAIMVIVVVFCSFLLPHSQDFYSETVWSCAMFAAILYFGTYHPGKPLWHIGCLTFLACATNSLLCPIMGLCATVCCPPKAFGGTYPLRRLKHYYAVLLLALALATIFWLGENYLERGEFLNSGYGGESFGWNPEAFWYNLTSPGRGIMWFTPGIFCFFLAYPAAKGLSHGILRGLGLASVLLYAVYSCWWCWNAGLYWGPRFFHFISLVSSSLLGFLLIKGSHYEKTLGKILIGFRVTPNKYSTHYSCVIRTLYFGRNGC